MAPTTRKGKGKAPSPPSGPPSGREKNRKTHAVQRKSMKQKKRHPVDLAITMHTLSSSSGRRYSVRIGDGGDLDSTFGIKEESVRSWVKEVVKTYSKLINSRRLKVGLALNRNINAKGGAQADTPYTHLTLCTGSHSLTVFLKGKAMCKPLLDFLQTNDGVTFTGIDMYSKREKLQKDCGILLKNVVDVLPLAKNFNRELEGETIEEVAAAVLGEEYALIKPDQVRLSDYDQPTLTIEQVKYAVFEAYLGLQLADVLLPQ